MNTEASTLRSQIAAKEYEIQRLERLKRKDASNELNLNLQQQQAELVILITIYILMFVALTLIIIIGFLEEKVFNSKR